MNRSATLGYANYSLGVLVIVYVFNFIDRQILSILAEEIKADLGLSDATIGYLYGTAFAVFYAIFGIPLARLADVWVRTRVIAIGLFFWSLMTAFSGIAFNLATLAALRIGVGVGEASASPAAFSLLGDLFPPRRRATAVAIYSSGIYIGIGLGIFLGGWVVEGWHALYPDGNAPFGLAAWQVAFFLVGLPGLPMACWVWSLREPVRGQQEGLIEPRTAARPLRVVGEELMSVVPPLTLYALVRCGAGGIGVAINLVLAVCCAGAAWLATRWLGAPAQWISLGIGLYAFGSWLQGLALRDRLTFSMIFRSRAMLSGMLGFGGIAFVGYGVSFWGPPFFLRVHGVSPGTGGTMLGLCAAIGGWLGVTLGGWLSDRMKVGNPAARPLVGILSALVAIPAGTLFVCTTNVTLAFVGYFLFNVAGSAWIAPAVALSSELVLPRMRATASAFYILSITFLGLALGPFTIGQVSDRLATTGWEAAAALRGGVLSGFVAFLPALVCLGVCCVFMGTDEDHRSERAQRDKREG